MNKQSTDNVWKEAATAITEFGDKAEEILDKIRILFEKQVKMYERI